MNIRLIIIFSLSTLLVLGHPLFAQKVQREHRNGKSKEKELYLAELSGVLLEYNPILKEIDTLHFNEKGPICMTNLFIREKEGNLPILIKNDNPPWYRIIMDGEKSIKATDFVFSLTGYECLSPDFFPFSKDPDHTDVVFVRRNDMLFYQKIGNNIAKKLNNFYSKIYEPEVLLSTSLSITIQFEPGSVFLSLSDENDNLRRLNSILIQNESLKLMIDMYTCVGAEDLLEKRKEFIMNQIIDIIFPDIPKERIEFQTYRFDDDHDVLSACDRVYIRIVKR